MRKSTFFLFLLSVLLLGTTEVIASSGSYTHTNTPIELKPTSLNNSFQIAAVCFLPDSGCSDNTGFITGGGNIDIDSGQKCIEEGFDKTECALPAYLSEVCSYNELYFKECKNDTKKACEAEGFKVTCEVGKIPDTTCPYDPNYKKCKCNPCEGYEYSLTEATAQGYLKDGSCNACGVEKYKRKLNPCVDYRTCECGGEIGANVCYTGNVKKYSNCKNCCDYRCNLTSCPANTTCTYEACSNKYCGIGCAINYTDWCNQPDTDCASLGYKSSANCEDGIKCPYGNAWYCSNSRPKCSIGWIYYSDNTCSLNVVASKTALGVVVYVNPDGIGGQAMATKSIGLMAWGGYATDIPSSPNYGSQELAVLDFNSCSNTDKIVDYGDSSTYPAAHAARNYAPTTETKGKWCLPAAGIMTSIKNNQSAVQAGIAKLGGTAFANYTWSSSESNYVLAWRSDLVYSYGLDNFGKANNTEVRPVLEF